MGQYITFMLVSFDIKYTDTNQHGLYQNTRTNNFVCNHQTNNNIKTDHKARDVAITMPSGMSNTFDFHPTLSEDKAR